MISNAFGTIYDGLHVSYLSEGDVKTLSIIHGLADKNGVIGRCRPIEESVLGAYTLDLSAFPGLSDDLAHNNTLMQRVLQIFQSVATKELIYFAKIDLSQNKISGRSLLIPNLRTICAKIQELNFSHTSISSEGLYHARHTTVLTKLSLDYCKEVDAFQDAVNSAMPQLEELSIVGSRLRIDPQGLKELHVKCPKLRQLDYTQRMGIEVDTLKLLGVTDPVTLSTIIDPVLYPCGHIMGKAVAKADQCYSHCASGPHQPFCPKITRFEFLGRWTVRLVDFSRNNLEGRIFYHPNCGNLFTDKSLQEILGIMGTDKEILTTARELQCPGCVIDPALMHGKALQLLRIYPELPSIDDQDEASQMQMSLMDQSDYIIPPKT